MPELYLFIYLLFIHVEWKKKNKANEIIIK